MRPTRWQRSTYVVVGAAVLLLVVAVDQPSAAELGPAQHTALARDLAGRGAAWVAMMMCGRFRC